MKKISRRDFLKSLVGGRCCCPDRLRRLCKLHRSSTASSAAGSTAASTAALSADTQAIVDRGVLKVGVKNAVQGFSFQDTLTGEYKGLEDSLAEMIAERLGVDVSSPQLPPPPAASCWTPATSTPFWLPSPSPKSARRPGTSPPPTIPTTFPFWWRTPPASRAWLT